MGALDKLIQSPGVVCPDCKGKKFTTAGHVCPTCNGKGKIRDR